MLFDTGIRNSELYDIKINDIKDNAILIHDKGDKERVVPITTYLTKIMFKYDKKRSYTFKDEYQNEYLFLSQKGHRLTPEIVKGAGKMANVNSEIRCSPYICRHMYSQMQRLLLK